MSTAESILIVEDEAVIAAMLESTLAQFGFRIAGLATSGAEAIERAQTTAPDLILMDIQLDGEMDGIEAARRITAVQNVPVVYLTAYSDDETLARAKAGSPFGFIPKPFKEDELKATVEIALMKHRTESVIRASESRYRSLFENSLDPIYQASMDGHILDANPAMISLFGYPIEELRVLDVRKLYVEPERREIFFHELATHRFVRDFETELVTKSGARIDIIESATILSQPGGEVAGYQGILRDVTEKKRRDETLQILRTSIESAAEMVMITARNGNVIYVNPVFERITGYSAQEIIGHTPRLLKSGYQPRNTYLEMWTRVLSGETWKGDFINRKKDGTYYTQRSTISPVINAQGQITHLTCIAADVTREKLLEEQLLQAVKMESLGRLAGGIAHDFNNLLTVINGYSELVLRQTTHEKSRADIMEIIHAGEKATQLTRQILAFSRRQEIHPERLNLNEVVLDLQKMIARLIGDNIVLQVKLHPEAPEIEIDRSQLEQVLMNLVVNARDALTEGGTLTIETARFIMDEEFCQDHRGSVMGDYARLTVIDNGIGMIKEIQEKIFEPFFTTKSVGQGTGLGLATVYGIVKQNRGYISVASEPGQGTRFDVYFPFHS